MTKQRELIKNIIVLSNKHLSAEEIFLKAKKEMPKIAFGTVYRNLGLLVNDQEIRKIEIIGNITHYDKNIIPHEHLLCEICGKVEDIPEIDISGITNELKDKYNITGYDFIIKHVCNDCMK